MLNSDEAISLKNELQSPTVSIILSTHNRKFPSCLHPRRVEAMIPKEVSSEIIVIACKQNGLVDLDLQSDIEPQMNGDEKTHMLQFGTEKAHTTIHGRVRGKFTAAIMRGSRIINQSVQKLPYIRTMISKTATIVRQGLKIHNVQDPLSCCFATSRPIIKDIHIEGKGDELLLEKLVKSNRNRKNNMIPVKEIPFSGEGEQTTKLDLDRILSYSKAVWHLYRYGEKSNRIQNEPEIVEQKQHNGSVSLKSSFKY